jgi:hypothetical protein
MRKTTKGKKKKQIHADLTRTGLSDAQQDNAQGKVPQMIALSSP